MRLIALALGAFFLQESVTLNQKGDGYRGIWYSNQPLGDQYVYKYSGGFATYPQQQGPIAIYAAEAKKTFFVYGGANEKNRLLHMVGYFDHRRGLVARPTLLLNKQTDDAHDNPVLSIDEKGHLWVFSNAHGTGRPSYVHRSRRPYDIGEFELVHTTNFSYAHVWHEAAKGFLLLETLYENKGRSMYQAESEDGRNWTKPVLQARIQLGQYQLTAHAPGRTATVFDMHPDPVGLNARTNIYYMETRDHGRSWRNVKGEPLSLPLREAKNTALVHDYQAEGLMVYLKEVAFDRDGQPIILYLTTRGYESGPGNGARQWYTTRWNGQEWITRPFTSSDHNYDHGGLWVEANGDWQIIAPTAPGPQPYTTGGDMVLWRSKDQGQSWEVVRQLTFAEQWNHTYAKKPVNVHPDFYAIWADGDTLKPSASRLYFTNREGSAVWQLPTEMKTDFARPVRIPGKPAGLTQSRRP